MAKLSYLAHDDRSCAQKKNEIIAILGAVIKHIRDSESVEFEVNVSAGTIEVPTDDGHVLREYDGKRAYDIHIDTDSKEASR